jgi:uncharacterized protein YlxW (UPF0749 family)
MPGRSTLLVAGGAAIIGFLVVSGGRSNPGNPAARVPQSARLVDLIASEQGTSAQLRHQADALRQAVAAQPPASRGGSNLTTQVASASGQAGLLPARGPGLRVILNDSTLKIAPSANIDDLVIHSQDVQAVVNALWGAGASAMAINGQRLVATSAVLCVGNTLLLDGTVHSPPYVVVALGASRTDFDADALVRRLHHDADVDHLGFSVERLTDVTVPAFVGPIDVRYASPVISP